MSNVAGNRNSTPEASNSSLRPPSSRQIGAGHHLRASADMGAYASALPSTRGIRPSSEVYFSQALANQAQSSDDMEKAAQQWLADIDQYEATLEEMATATLDQDFKDELSAIEQWFRVLSEAERTSALYALLQQTTQVQIRFFIQVLQEMAKKHPMSGILSPSNFGQKDAMTQKFDGAMHKLTVENRNSFAARPPPSPGNKRHSQLDPAMINSMFPDAAAAIAKQKEQFTQQTGMAPPSNRNSTIGDRTSLIAPTISAPDDGMKDGLPQPPPSPWRSEQPPVARPKSSSGLPPMGQFTQPPPSAGLRSPRPMISGDTNLQSTTLNAPDKLNNGLPVLTPIGNWASALNTPMMPHFPSQQGGNQADMVANATAMKLAALSTVNNRIQFDDVRKYRRARSSEGQGQAPPSPGIPPANFVMTNEHGHLLTPQQAASLQAQQLASISGRRSRPNSPGLMVPSMGGMGFAAPQNNGYLAAYDNAALVAGLNSMNLNMGMGQYGLSSGDLSDHGEMQRGRSPRGRRGSSKPPEDPSDIALLQDIPAWLRSLRLHKYTDNLKDLKWQEMVELDEDALEKRGVNALGARRKLVKTFETIKEKMNDGSL
ncbi:hypothetical protein EJ06DRAFT_530861 [Trichodelitschia bisporula]|uniref:RNA-binding protein VTS1 n=1 Tax=Trichodelitschia bisporula TaxID=703511 RepID=A0A6G1HVM4_9PEZI|nr:hypothetical protein EJ06DRAFT_530861 [Trichodelitschia bisporula]